MTIKGSFVINKMNNKSNDIGKTCLCFTLRIQWMTLNTPAMSQVNIIRQIIFHLFWVWFDMPFSQVLQVIWSSKFLNFKFSINSLFHIHSQQPPSTGLLDHYLSDRTAGCNPYTYESPVFILHHDWHSTHLIEL